MSDTIKTTVGGAGVTTVTWMQWLPEVISVVVGSLTALYFLIKIYKEFKG
jgi:TRAP-type C4-dicarboxylate transport system permease small subunit